MASPKNRKERRAAARETGKPISAATSVPNIKLAQPDRSKPKGKTLLDIYEEKQDLLDRGQPFDPKYKDGLPRGESGNLLEAGLSGDDDEPIGPIGDAFFWAVCLTTFHFTLDVLVYSQYAQAISWPAITKRSATILPLLWAMIYMVRSNTARRLPLARQFAVFAVGTATGCYTIHVGNVHTFFAVMKQAPALGTLWVWSVIEMDLWFALASVVFDLGYLFWNGYSAF